MKDEIKDIVKFVINLYSDVSNVSQSFGIYQSATDGDCFVLLKDAEMYDSLQFQTKAVEFDRWFSDMYGETVAFLNEEMNQAFNFDYQMFQTNVYNNRSIENVTSDINSNRTTAFSDNEKYGDTTGWSTKAQSSKNDSDDLYYSLAA